jgi:hypothetical protein
MNNTENSPSDHDYQDDPRIAKLGRGEAEITRESITAVEKWVDTQPIQKLREIIIANNWVLGYHNDEDKLPDAELREFMKSLLYEDKIFVGIALFNNGIPFEIEEY